LDNQPKCLYCGRNDSDLPLVNLTYQGKPLWICSEHLPILIHEPQKLAEQLAAINQEGK
jgi:hypothetical protein